MGSRLTRGLIVVTGLATGLIHLVLLNLLMGQFDPLFTLNGLGYLVLIGTYLINPPIVAGRRRQLNLLLIGYTAATIAAWIVLGDRGPLGIGTKVIEILLIAGLVMDLRGGRTE